jgi:hypothetical protein
MLPRLANANQPRLANANQPNPGQTTQSNNPEYLALEHINSCRGQEPNLLLQP